jgi:hypothetical protein
LPTAKKIELNVKHGHRKKKQICCSKTSNPFAGWRSMVTASLQLPHWTASEQMVQRKLCFPAWQDYLKRKHAAKKTMENECCACCAKQNQR